MATIYSAINNRDESAYLVVDYFPGGSLGDARVIGSLSPTENMIVIVGIIGQLAMLHKQGWFIVPSRRPGLRLTMTNTRTLWGGAR